MIYREDLLLDQTNCLWGVFCIDE